MTSIDPSRRKLLRVTGAALAGGAVAGCSAAPGESSDSGGGSGDGSSGEDGSTGDTPEPTASGDGSSGGEWTETSTVEMTDDLAFEPKKIKVEAGTTVTFENVGNIGHTVTAYEDKIPDGATYFASGDFDSESAASEGYKSDQTGNIPSGESYEVTLETTGTYEYYCIPHKLNGMVGSIKVV
ncbi:plastocyanin/azurin family copper-binding protein [Halosimplex aquaticum]|uniref:Plastocyanin/azurin family copper-binding protein n=1 Tax=Halosimplex aquaticum TaxID=3026162 RepID=A0ABD5YC12_9EURY|nr:plastocyanin/azurin family copper-binding protein [Halosimplex aquaticum]